MTTKYGLVGNIISICSIAALILGGFFVAPTAQAVATFNVDASCVDADLGDAICDDAVTYRTIQGAVDAADSGDTINVAAGIYTNDIWDSSLGTPAGYRITKSVTLLGANAGINPEGSLDRGGETILVRTNGVPYSLYADGITIDGFTFTSGDGSGGGRLIVAGDNVTIKNTIIKDIRGTDPHGIFIDSGADNVVIEYNTLSNTAWEAIASGGASNAIISHNYISGSGQHAIQWMNHTGSNNEISYNHISNLVGKNAIQYWGGSGAKITYNEIVGDNTMFDGIWLDSAADNAIVTNNDISGLVYAGINVRDGNTGTVINSNRIYGNGTGLVNYSTSLLNATSNWWGVSSGPTHALNGGGTGDGVSDNVTFRPWFIDEAMTETREYNVTIGDVGYENIQAAIDFAIAGDTIIVAAGTYYEHNITIDKSLTLTGDVGDAQPGPGTNAPIIDGESLYSDAFLLSNGVSDVTIQGFEIRNYIGTGSGVGNAVQAWVASTSHVTVNDNYMHNLSWNGVLVGNDGAIGDHSYWTIARNRLTDFGPNAFAASGYGMELSNTSHGVIEDNVIDAGSHFPGTGILVYNRRESNQDILIQRNTVLGQYDFAGINVQSSTEEVSASNLDNVRILNNDVSISGPVTPTVPSLPDTALRIRNKIDGTVTNVEIQNNKLTNASSGGRALANDTTEALDATNNWWGTADPDFGSIISGLVDYTPWWLNETGTTPEEVVLEPISTPGGVEAVFNNKLNTETTVGGITLDVTIPAGTTVSTTDVTWDGTINLPTVTTITLPVVSGEDRILTTAFEIGFPDVHLTFDNAVRILLPGAAGNRAGYIRAGIEFTEITATCPADDQASANAFLDPDSECKMDSGADLVIWTKHFTTFASYSATSTNSVSGGGGGGAAPVGVPPTVTPPVTTPPITPPGQVLGTKTWANGVLVKTTDNPTVYLAVNNELRPFTAAAIFLARGLKFSDIQTISAEDLSASTIGRIVGRPDGTLLKGSGPTVYKVLGDAKLGIPSMAAFNRMRLSLRNIVRVSDGELAEYDDGGIAQ